MCRDYRMMRDVLSTVANRRGALSFRDFTWVMDRKGLIAELERLKRESLIDGTLDFDEHGFCEGEVRGFTAEGQEFWNLIENESVWKPTLATLEKARIDLSYPMLKDVCEEIVRRYVASFIPEM